MAVRQGERRGCGNTVGTVMGLGVVEKRGSEVLEKFGL